MKGKKNTEFPTRTDFVVHTHTGVLKTLGRHWQYVQDKRVHVTRGGTKTLHWVFEREDGFSCAPNTYPPTPIIMTSRKRHRVEIKRDRSEKVNN